MYRLIRRCDFINFVEFSKRRSNDQNVVVMRNVVVMLGYQIYRFEFLFPEFEGTDFPLPE